ncbi:YTH domain-containing protein ECT2-like [Musa acuminata AAA Group]|uniref:YTH domain-containing protein ECT2-like n=1 Tax=Musa acuminata AAA Group TaxID=214697 RepID=UPI0031DE0011
MATTQPAPSLIDSREPLEPSIIDAEQKPVSTENLNEQPPSAEVEKNVSPDSSAIDHSRDALGQLVSPNAVGDLSASFPAYIMYNPQTQMHYYGGYENPTGEFEEYTHHFNTEGMEVGSAVAYSENHPLAYYTKHGCSPHIPYGPCYPVTMPLYSNGGDVLYYAPHHFSFSGIQCQQTAHPSMPHLSSSAPTSQIDFTAPVDQEGALLADTANSKSTCFGPRPGYHLSYGSYGRDWRIFPDGTFSVSPLPSSAVSIRLGRQIPSYGFGSLVNSYNRWYHNSGLHHDSTFGVSYPRVGSNGRSLIAAGKITKQERGNAPFGRSNGTLEFLSEQNRGPRADGSKNRANQQLSVNESDGVSCSRGVDRKLYNTLDFGTDYKDARFFIIKSYSEDNVHKSIKYGVWASTSNGNRKLNSAYVEMREQEHSYPIFLFFSVNASGHFCGVAEMIGPVDFEKSVDYWNKDKWTGQCPVKWHIVKDVPNTMFRHIILEKNDNKPVTNSRDTQEVKLEQGLEMLGIFNKHEYEESILDDFEFYEERETALRQRKACEHPTPTNSISQISNSFAQAVRF